MAAVKSTASVLYKIDEFGKCKELGFDPQKLSSLPGTHIGGHFLFGYCRLIRPTVEVS